MKFMLMIITDERAESALSASERDTLIGAHIAFRTELTTAGKRIASHRLRFGRDAKTIRLRGGQPIVTDGPFAESKEVLGGFYLIEAASIDEALTWAKKLPLREVGAIEVRPVWEE